MNRFQMMALFLFFGVYTHGHGQLVLNEILASNQAVNANSFGEYGDWIELYNASVDAIDLTGYFLSDSSSNYELWSFPSGQIEPGGFLLIWATSRDTVTAEGEIHTSFRVSNQETITLSDPQGQILDQSILPVLQSDNSWGRITDGDGDWAYFLQPTPNLSNSVETGYFGFLEMPECSHAGGLFPLAFELNLISSDPEAQILYTLDCSVPVLGAPSTYIFDPDLPINIYDRSFEPNEHSMIRSTIPWDGTAQNEQNAWFPPNGLVRKANVVRYKAIRPGYLDSELRTESYLVGNEALQSYEGIPILSLVTERDNYFSDTHGIYVPGTDAEGNPNTTFETANFTQNWEREAYLQFWEADRINGFESRVITQVHGFGSQSFNRKGLRMEFKGSEGISNLNYPIFGDGIMESFDRFVVRASGQDAHRTSFRDAVAHSFFLDKDILASRSRPVVVFINGEYWGIHNIRERADERLAQRVYQTDIEQMDCLEFSQAVMSARTGDTQRWNAIRDFVHQNDLDVPENYAAIAEMIDLDNFIEYYIAQIFVANVGWANWNNRFWRHKPEQDLPGQYYDPDAINPYRDGRFRWIFFDIDKGLGFQQSVTTNTLQYAGSVGTWNDRIFVFFRKLIGATDSSGNPVSDPHGLYSNGSQAFRAELTNRICDALNTNLHPSRTSALIDSFQAQYAPYIAEHIERWTMPETTTSWNSHVNSMRNFVNNRPTQMRNHVANKFQFHNGTANLSLDVNNSSMGYLQLNSLTLGANPGWEALPFTGIYFKDNPVSLRAIANPGYRFIGWIGIESSSDSLHLALSTDLQISAVFEPDEQDFEGDALNPEPYNLNLGPYSFLGFSPDSPAGTYPPNMRFLMAAGGDPNLNAEMTIAYDSPYNLESRTRIEGLAYDGIAMVNTGNPPSTGSAGYLGAMVLGLKTTGLSDVKLSFTAETMEVNSRIYGIALQYRIGTEGLFSDVLIDDEPVRYIRNEQAGHRQTFFGIPLPAVLNNQAYVQLRWKYYYISGSSGARPKLRLDDIFVYANNHNLPSGVLINEVMSSIDSWDHPMAEDDLGTFSDWIELYNNGDQPQNIYGCYLSDNEAHTGRWLIPNLSIAPHSFLLVRASNHNRQQYNQTLHTNFAISSAGEPIYLVAPDGTVLDFVAEQAIPTDHSLARIPDGSDNWVISNNPSPIAPNLGIMPPQDVQIVHEEGVLRLSWQAEIPNARYQVYAADSPQAEIWQLILSTSESYAEFDTAELGDRQFFIIRVLLDD